MLKRAQSILEYVIVLTAIIAAVIWGAKNVIQPVVQNVYRDSGGAINSKSSMFLNLLGGGGSQSYNANTTAGGSTTGGGS